MEWHSVQDLQAMTVAREEVKAPTHSGKAVVSRIYRAAAGCWSAEIQLDLVAMVGDGRQVMFRKTINVRATEQRGRKSRSE